MRYNTGRGRYRNCSPEARNELLRADAETAARQIAGAGQPYVLFEYDGTTGPLWGWATPRSPLGRHVLGLEASPAFSCYANVRKVEVRG